MAVQPVTAATITTDAEGLTADEVKVKVGDETIPAYRAMPKEGGPFPVVLVVQEIFGVHEHIKDICRRFAKLGYFAIAPELYARQADVSKLSIDEIRAIVPKVPDAQVLGDLDACVEFAAESGKGDITRLGITGFCWGGRIVWLYAAHNADLKAGAAWYGHLRGKPDALRPVFPIDLVNDLRAPVLGLYGGADAGIPLADVQAMRDALSQGAAAARASVIEVYKDAPHAFHADYRPSYREEAARDGWKRMLAWFAGQGA